MTGPKPDDQGPPPTSADPTMKVPRPPVPGRAVRADVAAGNLATPPIHPDESTVTLDAQTRTPPHRTLEFGTPAAVNVTVGPRPKPRRRRHRTWPWIAAVVLVLIVLGAVLLVMMLRGATIDADTDLVGQGAQVAASDRTAVT